MIFIAVQHFPVWKHLRLPLRSSTDGESECFPIWGISDRAAVNILVGVREFYFH